LDSEGEVFEPEEIPSLISAFEGSLQRLRLVDRSDPAVLLVARRVIALAREGVRDPIVLRDQVVKSFTNGVD
jgi:hypothetical protein